MNGGQRTERDSAQSRTRERIQTVVEIGLAIAVAAALNAVALWRMPQGGSVSLEMAPIVIVALRRGLKAGVLTGVLWGMLDMAIEPFVVHPLQFVLDYPLAYGLVGLAGLFAGRWQGLVSRGATSGDAKAIYLGQMTAILPAALLGAGMRLLAHLVSGAVFFASYAPVGQNAWLYSLVYNATYLVPSGVAVAIVLWIVQPIVDTAVPFSRAASRA